MLRKLARDNWNVLLEGLAGEQAWLHLKGRIYSLVEKYVPERRRRNNNRPPWLYPEILQEIRRKKRLEAG
jgi:hypothetical protein